MFMKKKNDIKGLSAPAPGPYAYMIFFKDNFL